MNRRRKKGFRTGIFILWVLIVLLVLASITVGICVYLAFQDDYKTKYSFYQSDDTLMYTTLKGAVFGETFTLTETQVNTYLNNEIVEKSDNNIKNLRVYFKNGVAEVYARINYLNHDFGLYAKAKISLDTVQNAAAVQLYDAKLGRLPVSDSILKDTISQNVEETKNVSVKDGIIYIKSSYDFNINAFTLNLTFKNLAVGDGILTCQTNSLANDALAALTEALKTPEGREQLKELFKFAFSADSLVELGLDGLDKLIPDLRDLDEIKDKIISRFSDTSE